MLYAMKRRFANGRATKRAIVVFQAESEKQAMEAFGAGRYWSGFPESAAFVAEILTEVPKDRKVVSAALLIANAEKFYG